MKIFVIDTNVFVSAFLSPHGAPGRLLEAMADGKFMTAYDSRVLLEYIEVLSRPKFRLKTDEIEFLKVHLSLQESVSPIYIKNEVPDESDKMFMEVALATADRIIVTGNKKHYPPELMKKLNISVLSPVDALKLLS